MSQIIRPQFHTSLANVIVEDLQLLRSRYYYFLGKTEVWGNTDIPPFDVPIESEAQDIEIRNNIMFMKKITSNDVTISIPRYDWSNGTIYDKWDDAVSMDGKKFYVLNSSYRVYKCLDNNGGIASTSQPTGTSTTGVIVTADGYIWKYMYTIPDIKRTKFLNSAYMPVQRALSDSFYNKGSIETVSIINQGTGYNGSTTITISGDGSGAVLTPTVSGGKITNVVVTSPGIGYTYANLTVNGIGSGADIKAILGMSDIISDQSTVEQNTTPGAIYAVNVDDQGTNYTSSTVISIQGNGTNATAVPVISDGKIIKIQMTSYGSGYTHADVIISDSNRITGTDAVTRAIISPVNGHGYDAVRELRGKTLTISSSLGENTTLKTLGQQFRQYGIIKDPFEIDSGNFAKLDSEIICFQTKFADTTNLVIDEVLTQNSNHFRVVYISGTTVFLQSLSNTSSSPTLTTALTAGARSYTILSILSYPVINKYTGSLMFLSNDPPFYFTDTQNIVVKTYIKM